MRHPTECSGCSITPGDADAVRDALRAQVAERLGSPDGVLVVDDTGFLCPSPGSPARTGSPTPASQRAPGSSPNRSWPGG